MEQMFLGPLQPPQQHLLTAHSKAVPWLPALRAFKAAMLRLLGAPLAASTGLRLLPSACSSVLGQQRSTLHHAELPCREGLRWQLVAESFPKLRAGLYDDVALLFLIPQLSIIFYSQRVALGAVCFHQGGALRLRISSLGCPAPLLARSNTGRTAVGLPCTALGPTTAALSEDDCKAQHTAPHRATAALRVPTEPTGISRAAEPEPAQARCKQCSIPAVTATAV